ncbi:MAG TPA: hypothetical protein VFX70_07210 [Mycobacteriales bacterium]|nr:hypothetical protein [Mycobacteriales bacterium]
MRTWLLTPDGVWTEVTDRLAGRDSDPACWPWQEVLSSIGSLDALHVAHNAVLTRADLSDVHRTYGDRWMANLIWSTLCTDHVDRLTVTSTTVLDGKAWLAAVGAWAGRPAEDPPPLAWQDRRSQWMLWAHSATAGQVPLDGARVVAGAAR